MKQHLIKKFTALFFAICLLAPVALLAQNEDKADKEKKEMKEQKEVKEKKEQREVVTITHKSDTSEKITIEINGDKVTVNGKPYEEYKDKEGDINVKVQKLKAMAGMNGFSSKGNSWSFNSDDNGSTLFNEDANRAMLGVGTEKNETGVRIQEITKGSAAEKASLKQGDVITAIDDKKIETPDELSTTIRAHKPGDKINITYLRDKKEQKITAELTKWKALSGFGKLQSVENFNMNLGDMDFNKIMPRGQSPRTLTPYGGQSWSWSGGSPKLGLSVQDTDDGKGVKVIDVDEDSNAGKAGIKEEDIITEVDGKAVNSTDEIVKIMKDAKDKVSYMVKLQRKGKTQNIEVKVPRKLKTADL